MFVCTILRPTPFLAPDFPKRKELAKAIDHQSCDAFAAAVVLTSHLTSNTIERLINSWC